jgi:hypothetical protein
MSLPKAIVAVGKIFDEDRRNPVDREVAAKHIGYSGKSGASDKALAALAHFGLTDKVGKGAIRVSQLAMDILHPDPSDPQSKDRALLEAGMMPQIFKELRNQFPGHVSDSTLESYMVRIGFNDAALGPAMTAYLETMRHLEQSKAFESGGDESQEGPESDLQNEQAGEIMNQDVHELQTGPVVSQALVEKATLSGEREWMRNPLGRGKAVRVLVTGAMSGKDIGKLIKLLEAQKAILDDDEPEEDYDL